MNDYDLNKTYNECSKRHQKKAKAKAKQDLIELIDDAMLNNGCVWTSESTPKEWSEYLIQRGATFTKVKNKHKWTLSY